MGSGGLSRLPSLLVHRLKNSTCHLFFSLSQDYFFFFCTTFLNLCFYVQASSPCKLLCCPQALFQYQLNPAHILPLTVSGTVLKSHPRSSLCSAYFPNTLRYEAKKKKKGLTVISDGVPHKPWHWQASRVSIIHCYPVKSIMCNCIFYEAPVGARGV